MPRDARHTRERLLRAAERLFAERGVDGARTRDIVEAAGQSNDSAVQYHFGSRQGILDALLARHVEAMEGQRRPTLAALERGPHAPDPHALLAAVIEPVAAELRTSSGRDFLRIIAQLAGHAGVRTHSVPEPIRGTALARELELLEQCCRAELPESVALERIALMISMLTAALADRAYRIEHERAVLLDHPQFVANLVAMLTAALRAPHSSIGAK